MEDGFSMKIIVKNKKSLNKVTRLIRKLNRINKISFKKLEMILDYSLDNAGEFVDEENSKIYINPDSCDRDSLGDYSLFFVCVHEYAHLLDHRLRIWRKFEAAFPEKKDRLYINSNSRTNIIEELAEIMTIYIVNPYLLKMISKTHWKFLRQFFKSPVACTPNNFVEIYNTWSSKWKANFRRRFGIHVRGDVIFYKGNENRKLRKPFRKMW